ncbi:type II toxin-antitoxin system VapC family toxin [Parasediminibacterium sp. JCM 36343]|uniref:type II toxin-antitoxin system VapC family toxin n=1 Tax=Parasediminibacterium sp. JCM 36343 TaxID=3374279 RepID=UPI00397E0E96
MYLDSSVLIDYFRKPNKENTFFSYLSKDYDSFLVSVIIQYEVYIGATILQKPFWDTVFNNVSSVPFTSEEMFTSIQIQSSLKPKRKSIDFKDLIIAATALHHNTPLATINEKYFIYIDGLQIITPSSYLP